jgi:hypothetical protein
VQLAFLFLDLQVAEIAECTLQERARIEIFDLLRSAGAVVQLLGCVALNYQQASRLEPRPIGVKANYSNLERFIDYSHDQNLLNRRIAVESLFPEQVLDT